VSVIAGRDGDRVAGVHAHRIDVLDRADDDEVVRASRMTSSSNSFQPSTLSSTSTSCVGDCSRPSDLRLELLAVVRDAAARAAERERRPQDDREAESRATIARASSTECA
jgi:hypothetical protein